MTNREKMTLTRREMLRSTMLAGIGAGVMTNLPSALLAQTPQDGGNMVMLVHPEPPTLAQYMVGSGNIPMITTQVYEGLLAYDMQANPLPSLAKAWEVSPDGLTVTFQLQDGIRFHNGEPFTSADVKYSIWDVAKKLSANGTVIFGEVTEIEAPDPLTVILRLKRPAPYMMKSLSSREVPILSAKVFEGTDPLNNPTANAPIGTGPFKFVNWERGQYVRLERNDEYWKPGLPHLKRIVARFIPDAATRSAALEAGEAQYAAYSAVNPADIKRLEANPELEGTTEGYELNAAVSSLEFNMRRGPLAKKEVRQALCYAIDRQFIVDNVLYGFGRPATGPLSSVFKVSGFYTDDVRRFDVPDRIEIANRLLDEAGYPRGADGMRFGLMFEVNPFGEQWLRQGEYLKQAFAQVGVDLTLRSEDTATWLRRCYTDYDYDINSPFYSAGADPVIGVHRHYYSGAIRQGTTFVNNKDYRSPVLDKLLEDATVETDPAKRISYYHEAQRVLTEDCPNAWLAEVQYVTITSRRVHDHVNGPLGTYQAFEKTWMES